MSREWPQDEPRDVAARVERCGQRLTGELRKPITAPCGSLTHLAAPRLFARAVEGGLG